jgi:hypothetical protein
MGVGKKKKSTFTVTIRKKRIEMRFGNDKSGIGTGNSCYVFLKNTSVVNQLNPNIFYVQIQTIF